jgi:uncharacterized integral membrane protein
MTEPQGAPLTREQRAHRVRIAIALILAVVLVVFAFQNRTKVNIDFVIADSDTRLIYVILGAAVLGAIIGALIRYSWRHRDRRSS